MQLCPDAWPIQGRHLLSDQDQLVYHSSLEANSVAKVGIGQGVLLSFCRNVCHRFSTRCLGEVSYSWANVLVVVSQGFCGAVENAILAMSGQTIMSDRQAEKEAYSIVQQVVQGRMPKGKSTTLPQKRHEPSSHSLCMHTRKAWRHLIVPWWTDGTVAAIGCHCACGECCQRVDAYRAAIHHITKRINAGNPGTLQMRPQCSQL